ncbi:MAG: sensor histidine kinase [Lachnospiraceae bacterium]
METVGQKLKLYWLSCSMKQKYWYFITLFLGIFFVTGFVLCGGIFLLLHDTENVLETSSLALEFQIAMEEEKQALQEWAVGAKSGTDQALAEAKATTEQAFAVLEDYGQRKWESGLSDEDDLRQYQQIWSIQNSYEVYQQKLEQLLLMNRTDEKFVNELYTLYDMQSYLIQYSARFNRTIMELESQQYQKQSQLFRWIPAGLMVLFGFLCILVVSVSHWIDRFFIEPVLQLSKDAKRMAHNDFEGKIPERKEQDEIGELMAAFEKMKYATVNYIVTLKEKSELQIQLEKVQLQMLKSQVNPHFLFNTLNTISCMAQMEEADTTDQMILALSRLFQYALKSSETVTLLSNEVKVVQDYLYLQKIRFEERIQYRIDVDEEAGQRLVPSFLLQPLVENSIVHGISNKEEGGQIYVKARVKEDRVWISVADTGVGIDEETLKLLREGKKKPQSGHGIGLGNIYKRVHIMYQNGSVEIYSRKGHGTVVQISFAD